MNTLVRYVLSEQFKVLLLTLGTLVGINLAVAVLDKLRRFLAIDADFSTMLQYFALGLPKVTAEVMPFALLIATVVALGGLSARSEITAMRAAGISVVRVVVPLLGLGLLVSLVMAWASLSLVPHANGLAQRVMDRASNQPVMFSRDRMWFKAAENTIFGIRSADPDGTTMWGVRILQTDGNGRITRLTQANKMVFSEGRWQLHQGRHVAAMQDDSLKLVPFASAPAPLARPPQALGNISVPHNQLSYGRLADYIDRLKADGYATRNYEVELARRIAYPFAAFIMVLVAIPHGITPPRSHNLSKGIGVSLLIATVFWLLYSLSLALGRAALLPPLAAAWLPLAVFAAYGINRLLTVRQ